MNRQQLNTLLELDDVFRKLVRKFVKERDRFQLEGVTLQGFLILRKISSAGEQRLTDLAEELDLSSGAITAQCDKLEELGFAQRVRYRENRRTIYLVITDEGEELIQRYPLLGQFNAEVMFQGFSHTEIERLLNICRRMLHNVNNMSEKTIHKLEEEIGINDGLIPTNPMGQIGYKFKVTEGEARQSENKNKLNEAKVNHSNHYKSNFLTY